jgi:mRNA-degrading endonuclease HigB of HigAB toxin-antitoxin module
LGKRVSVPADVHRLPADQEALVMGGNAARLLVLSRIVFNVGGNKYRLIAAIHFNRARVYVRHVLTHEEYNQGAWRS